MSIDLTKMPKLGFGLMRLPETFTDHRAVTGSCGSAGKVEIFPPL